MEAEQLLRERRPNIALLMAETALVNGADAVLLLHGFSVNSHAARFAFPHLPAVYRENPGFVARIRTIRNESLYGAGESVSPEFALRAITLARNALHAVRSIVPADLQAEPDT